MPDITENDFWNMLNEPEPVITTFYDGSKSYYWYNKKGQLHRENDLPAVIRYTRDGSVSEKAWFINGKYHRIGDPARIDYITYGSIGGKYWFQNGKRHNLDGPAFMFYYKNKNIGETIWFQNGKRHRIGGPAQTWYVRDGSIEKNFWYINGKKYTEEEYLEKLREMGYE